ncbi:MAG: hypothetical protein IPO07_13690 [Haliscomenobacter sp.]|nr:hypothetical protein [Haliscomenobacter sp.]
MIFSLGCLTGKLYDRQNSLSERFILVPNRGGIAYIASSGFANDGALEFYLTQFYRPRRGALSGWDRRYEQSGSAQLGRHQLLHFSEDGRTAQFAW